MNRRRLLSLLRFVVSVALLALLYRRVDLAQVRAIFAETRAVPVVILFALLFLNTSISALKWKILLQADGIDIPLAKLTASYLVGSFFNVFLPSNIGGDAYRVYDVAQLSKRTAHSFASVLADRLSGFVALVTLGFVFGLIGFRQLPNAGVMWIPVLAMLALAVAIAMLFQRRLMVWCLDHFVPKGLAKVRAFAMDLLDSVDQYRAAPGLFAQVMGLSFLFQLTACCCVWVLALSLGFHMPFMVFLMFVPFISLLEALPISIYGIGVRDTAYVVFFTQAGLARVEALTLALAYVIMTLIYSSSGGVIFLLRPVAKKP